MPKKRSQRNRGAGLTVAVIVLVVFSIMTASFASYAALTAKVNVKTANTLEKNCILTSVDYAFLYAYLDNNTIATNAYTYNDTTYDIVFSQDNNSNIYTVSSFALSDTQGYTISYDTTHHLVVTQGWTERVITESESE